MADIQININSNCCKRLLTKDKICNDNIKVNVNVPAISTGYPTEVATAAEMNALLISSNIGNIYKFTGPTDSVYTNGELYEVVQGFHAYMDGETLVLDGASMDGETITNVVATVENETIIF